jgi:hypothetical protein
LGGDNLKEVENKGENGEEKGRKRKDKRQM